jgi:hypothetical protein
LVGANNETCLFDPDFQRDRQRLGGTFSLLTIRVTAGTGDRIFRCDVIRI